MFGILDSRVLERLLKNNLLLEKADEICCFHEVMVLQMKVVGDIGLSVAVAETVNELRLMINLFNLLLLSLVAVMRNSLEHIFLRPLHLCQRRPSLFLSECQHPLN